MNKKLLKRTLEEVSEILAVFFIAVSGIALYHDAYMMFFICTLLAGILFFFHKDLFLKRNIAEILGTEDV